MIKEAIRKLIRGHSLSEEMAGMAMAEILDGRATIAQMASFTTALRIKGETVDEITGCAKAMRSRIPKVHLDNRMVNIDRKQTRLMFPRRPPLLLQEEGLRSPNMDNAQSQIIAGVLMCSRHWA